MTDLITLPRATVQQVLDACTAVVFGWRALPPLAVRRAAAESLDDLRAALEQPEPPPEAQTEAEKIAYCAGWWAAMEQKREQPEQEPLAIATVDESLGVVFKFSRSHTLLPGQMLYVYTHPPRREWRSLSEGEIIKLVRGVLEKPINYCEPAAWQLADGITRAVEAKLKEKNHE